LDGFEALRDTKVEKAARLLEKVPSIFPGIIPFFGLFRRSGPKTGQENGHAEKKCAERFAVLQKGPSVVRLPVPSLKN